MKELQNKKPKEEKHPWKQTQNYNYAFDKDVRRLTGRPLTNTEIVSKYLLLFTLN